ncbi:MAG TPA: hypothetical protein VF221_01850 [Chloroflexota bacterium]
MRRLPCIALVVSLWSITLTGRSVRAEQEMLAGHWHLDFYGRCVITAGNEKACRLLQGPASFAATSVPGATLTVRGIGEYISDRSGRFSVRFSTWITERVPHAGRPSRCDNAAVFLGVFTGTCREVGTGHGHIAAGMTGMPDFWEDDTTGSWSGPSHARFATSGATDTFNPACPGTYDTKRFLELFGVRPVPAGIEAHVTLVHRP